MSIRMIAREVYRLQQQVEKLEKELNNAPSDKKDEIKEHLRKLRAERERVRRILEGSKEPPPYRKPL